MDGKIRLIGKVILPLTMLAGTLGTAPSQAEPTEIARGTVTVGTRFVYSHVNHETISYYLEGCTGNHPNATFVAFIDVRAYRDRVLRFSPAGAQLTLGNDWRIRKGTECVAEVAQPGIIDGSSPVEWKSDSNYLAIYKFSPAYNSNYLLEVLPT